jgi:hypothetical protein
MFKLLTAMCFLAVSAASAQVTTTNRVDNVAQTKDDPNRIVCQKEEQIGSRLGAKKVCLPLAEWQARQNADREQTERAQSGARVCANPPC